LISYASLPAASTIVSSLPCRLPFALVYFIALVLQMVVVPLLRLVGRDMQSDFTPARIKITAVNRTFSCAAARRDFGYKPKVRAWGERQACQGWLLGFARGKRVGFQQQGVWRRAAVCTAGCETAVEG
jgi:hypothetical protein